MPETITPEMRDAAAAAGPGSPEAEKVEKIEAQVREEAKAAEEAEKKAAEEKAAGKPAEGATAEDENKGDLELGATEQETFIPPTGNKIIDDVGALLAEKKIPNADKVIAEFAETGELTLSAQAALVEGLGETLAALTINQLTGEANRLKSEGESKRKEILDYANNKFSGQDAELTWKQMKEFTETPDANISDEDRASMNKMLQAGGLQAKLVVDKIAEIYYADRRTTSSADLLEGDTYSNSTFSPLSRAEYVNELRTAVQKYGEHSPQVNELNRRRELSLERGF